ncbi:MAG: hypothetical protein RL328_1324 [Acidobacteriota bacterium]|jgi:hypothetical protein
MKLAHAALTLATLTAAVAVLAQGPPGNPQLVAPKGGKAKGKAAPAPKLPDGTPDLAGLWTGFGSNAGDISKALKPGSEVVMLDWAEALFKTRQAKDDPQGNCLPSGIPRGNPYPWRFVQDRTHTAAERIYVLYEGNIHSFRQIFMDGRPHPEDPDPTWWGHSIGKWEGDTLVVDTIGFNDLFWFDFLGHPHTEQLHTVERYRRTDMNTMEIEVTIEDPGAYKKPFTTVGRARLMPGDELAEYVCQENNSDLQHIVGAAQVP